jgi:NADPH:quinone reductase-like Zn-dependent oxidoreductase
MKAMIYKQYGAPDVLTLEEVDKPVPKTNEVLIRVHAASVNDWDWGLLTGDFVNRILNGILRPKKMHILGCDIAGKIEAIGENVSHFQPGDDVYGDLCEGGFGGFAEYVCADENSLASKPATMSYLAAAAIPQAAMLAQQGLFDIGKIQSGQKLLINGAGGGVGTFAIQLIKSMDVEVTGVDSADKLDMLRGMGFDHVIDYRLEDFTRNGKRYDLILDAKTNRSPRAYLRALEPNGTYATVGGAIGRLLQVFISGWFFSKLTNKHIRLVTLKPNKDLNTINELFEAGKFDPVIDGPYKLSELPAAMRHFGKGQHKGKIVIAID